MRFVPGRSAVTLVLAFLGGARDQQVMLDRTHRIRMKIRRAIGPSPFPSHVVEDQRMVRPCESGDAPAPGAECRTEPHTKVEPDCCTDRDAVMGCDKNRRWIVVGNDEVGGIDRQNLDLRTATDADAVGGVQVAKVPRLDSHPLYRLYHILPLGKKRRADFLSPCRV